MECANQDLSINNHVCMTDCPPFEFSCHEEHKSYQPMSEEKFVSIDNLIKLREGMLFDQVVELIGHPDKVKCLGEGVWFLFYSLPEKSELRIALGPSLIWARLIVSETEIRVVA